MKKAAVTIRDVSAKCGLSVSTVSKALNDYSDISAETRELVLKTAREIGYHPNAIARTLKTNRSYNLGVLFQEETSLGLTHHFFAAILNAFKIAAEKQGYDITFINHNIGGRGMTYLEHCRYRNVDGVCIVCANFDDPEVRKLAQSDLPCVTIDHEYDCCSCVLNENTQGMRELVRCAAALGHRRIAYAFGHMSSVTRERLAAFREELEAQGLEVVPEYQVAARYIFPSAGYDATMQLMKLPNPPTCVLLPDDHTSLGARDALEELGLKVPEDVSLGGYDGIQLTQMTRPKLTTIEQDTARAGAEAAQMLIGLIESPHPSARRRAVIPGRLLRGESMGPAKG